MIHVLDFQVQMSNWTSCHNPNTWILFALWFKITFQYDIVVILQVLHFQVQMSNWTSCYNPNTRILFALWFKLLFSTTLWCWFMSWTFKSRCHNANTRILFALWFKITSQYDIVVILQVLHFQVQMLNWTSCYNPNTRILFALVVYMISSFTPFL